MFLQFAPNRPAVRIPRSPLLTDRLFVDSLAMSILNADIYGGYPFSQS